MISKGTLFLAISTCVLGGCISGYHLFQRETINIFIEKPESSEIYFFSSLDGFKPRKVERYAGGRWMAVAPADREFSYFFIVDGHHYIPSCRLKESDGYGNQNCIYSPQ